MINHQFCSFKTTIGKAKSDKTHFCKHPYSVTGLCNRTSCPLANSKYATLREDNGRVYLCVKTVERAHTPKNLWEKILLPRNYSKALALVDEHLQYFPKAIVHRNKQRLTKIHQYLIRMRKIELKIRSGRKAKMVGIHRKIEQREERRERKALVAAKIERNIEKELVGRLAKGTYGDIYNFHETAYKKALEGVEDEQEQEEEEATAEMESEGEMEMEDEEESEGMVEYVEELESDEEDEEEEFADGDYDDLDYLGNGQWGTHRDDDDDDEDEDDDSGDGSSEEEDDASSSSDEDDSRKKKPDDRKKKEKKRRPESRRPRGPRVEIEYEEEREDEAHHQLETAAAGTAW